MIDYSIYLKPNPLDESAAPKAYAKAQMRESISFPKFLSHIVAHGSEYSRGTVYGVVTDICACIVELLLDGNKVQLGDLGDFWLSLACEGTNTMEEFTAKNIKEVNIIFTPGEDFKNLVSKADFNLVASRAVQAATIKALKANDDSVDLTATRSGSSGSGSSNKDDTGNTDSNNGGTSDDGGLEV